MIGYDHPFFDGNGRTARALFYWVMAKEGFWLMEHVSISTSIKLQIDGYLKAYLYAEYDDKDVTYFIMHQLGVIKKSIQSLKKHLQSKAEEMIETEEAMAGSGLMGKLNHRQLALVKNALCNPAGRYTVKSHQNSHGVVQQTSRADLLALSEN
jgi:Fic family protein